jgi:AsmA family/AsmA-like C-terminal region
LGIAAARHGGAGTATAKVRSDGVSTRIPPAASVVSFANLRILARSPMRKALIIGGSIIGVVILVVAGLMIYAATNLNSIIAENRTLLLDRASTALGRKVEVTGIHASIGWGVMADLTGVTIADDPAFSQRPFVQAGDVYAKVEFLPLLARRIRVTRIALEKPEIRLIRAQDGKLNVSTIGAKHEEKPREKPAPGAGKPNALEAAPRKKAKSSSILEALHVRNLAIDGGKIVYIDHGAAPIAINAIDLQVTNFSFGSAFDVALRFAALGDEQNFEASATAGPLMSDGSLNVGAMPIDLKAKIGPIALDQVRKLAIASKAIPPKLSISDAVSLGLKASGRLDALNVTAASDLTKNAIAFGDSFNKPAGLPLKFSAIATRTGSQVAIKSAALTLGEMDLKAANLAFGGGKFSGRLDSNRFDIGSLAKLAPAAAKLGVTGQAEIHADVKYAAGSPTANGTITLADVSVPRPGQSTPLVSGLSGDIKLDGAAADIGPLKFSLGSGRATLQGRADPIYPTNLTYRFSADALKTSDFAKDRPADEQLNQVSSSGTVELGKQGPDINAKVASASGNLNNIAYHDFALTASLAGKHLDVKSLKLGAFDGTIDATAATDLKSDAPFTTTAKFQNLDVQKALESQKSKAAGIVRGILSGQAQISGVAGKFDQVKQTFDGNGRIELVKGKLVGVNVVADALRKVEKLPVVGNLLPDRVVANHPELFKNPDTDIDQMSLSFLLKGPRITSHDILVKSVDYSLAGDGWFDMDKHIDLAARILLSRELSNELVQAKGSIAYVTNRDRQVDIPLQITGTLPKPLVVPNVAELAQRAGSHALEEKGKGAIEKFLPKKLRGFLGGGSGNGGGASPNGTSTPASPSNPLKKYLPF